MLRSLLTAAVALVALTPPAAAQFSQFAWTQVNPGGLLMFPGAAQLGIGGGSGGASGSAFYWAVAPVDALVTATGTTIATPKGDCGDSQGFYGEGGSLQILSDCTSGQALSFSVHAGKAMVFGLQILVTTLPGDVWYSGFSFTPYWENLGGELGGTSGAPLLTGAGVPEPGELLQLMLTDAAPAAATALVLGTSAVNQPFKGGMLVPAPDVILPRLTTDVSGALAVGSPLPAGLPPGFSFAAQAWVADAGAPQGWAATNAVRVTAH